MLNALMLSVRADTFESSCMSLSSSTVESEPEFADRFSSSEAHALDVTCIRMALAKAESLRLLCRFLRGMLALWLCSSRETDELGESLQGVVSPNMLRDMLKEPRCDTQKID